MRLMKKNIFAFFLSIVFATSVFAASAFTEFDNFSWSLQTANVGRMTLSILGGSQISIKLDAYDSPIPGSVTSHYTDSKTVVYEGTISSVWYVKGTRFRIVIWKDSKLTQLHIASPGQHGQDYDFYR